MVRVDDLKTEINGILKNVAEILDVKDYEVDFNVESDKGNGFLGEFFMANLIDKEKNEDHHIAIKRQMDYSFPSARDILFIALVYKNENNFYSIVFPALDKFQKERGVKAPFAAIPKYYCGSEELYQESVVMEDVSYLGFQLHDKTQPLSEQQIRLILNTYGKYHALTFAYKDQQNKEYNEVVSKLEDYYTKCIINLDFWRQQTNESAKKIAEFLKSKHLNEVASKFEQLGDDLWEIFRDVSIYKGEYKTLLHGDCWSNNMMFKYDDCQQLVDMKMLDFQLAREATPVFDLSYFLYASGSKKSFDQLDHYLDIYYASFSDFAKELGSDPQKIYPIGELKKDWKNYAFFGLVMALNILPIRTQKKEEIGKSLSEPNGFENAEKERTENEKKDTNEFFLKCATDVVVHCYEYGVF